MFIGRVGTAGSTLGDVVLGIVDSFGLTAISFRVHALSSREVRVLFDRPVTDSALSIDAYLLGTITVATVVPAPVSVSFYDADRLSVSILLSQPMTTGSVYTLQARGIQDFEGRGVTGSSSNFRANAIDPPKPIGAFLGRRGTVDLVFDRPVGVTSASASAQIRNPSSGPGNLMTLMDWTSESIPSDTIRFQYSVTPTANSFVIDYYGVVDSSNNSGSGTATLYLSLRGTAPYSASDLGSMRFIDAYVVDVMPTVNMATIRVFFNCNALSSDVVNPAKWQFDQAGPHLAPDTVNTLTDPDATDLSSAIVLLNSARTKLSNHAQESPVHISLVPGPAITAPPATDLGTSITLFNNLRSVYNSHVSRASGVSHVYPELGLALDLPELSDSGIAAGANSFKSLFNTHLAASRSLQFSSALPSIIGPIVNRASIAMSSPARSTHTFFADLRVSIAAPDLPIRVRGTILSEDSWSVTNPASFTGDISARPCSAPASVVGVEPLIDYGALLTYDKEVSVLSAEMDPVIGSVTVSVGAHLRDVAWFLNNLIFAYDRHIGPIPEGAGHPSPEMRFFISDSDYVVTSVVADMVSKANSLKVKYNGHVLSVPVHTNAGSPVMVPDAMDLKSLLVLLPALRDALRAHNGSADSTGSGSPAPTGPGHHVSAGKPYLSAPLFTRVSMEAPGLEDGIVHTSSVSGACVTWSVEGSKLRSIPFSSSPVFTSSASRPSMASALPLQGLVLHENREARSFRTLGPDHVEVYFSKRMRRSDLNMSSISLTGGSMVVGKVSWVNDMVVSMEVSRMEQIPYTLSSSGLSDVAGNPVL